MEREKAFEARVRAEWAARDQEWAVKRKEMNEIKAAWDLALVWWSHASTAMRAIHNLKVLTSHHPPTAPSCISTPRSASREAGQGKPRIVIRPAPGAPGACDSVFSRVRGLDSTRK